MFHGEELLEFLNQWSIAKISILEIINILMSIIVPVLYVVFLAFCFIQHLCF